jgi:hypothetical protein
MVIVMILMAMMMMKKKTVIYDNGSYNETAENICFLKCENMKSVTVVCS